MVFSLLTLGTLLSRAAFGQENCSDQGKYSLQTGTECLMRSAVYTQGHTMITHTHTHTHTQIYLLVQQTFYPCFTEEALDYGGR